MADRYEFQSPFARGADADPWFRVGDFPVNTTAAVTGAGIFGLLLWAVEGGGGSLTDSLSLSQATIESGQIWRIATWIIPPASSPFWALLGLVFFFMIGSQFEAMLGRRNFTMLVGALVLIPGALGALTATVLSEPILNEGLGLVFLGIAAGLAASMPGARSFFGLPFWGVVAFIFAVRYLGALADGNTTAFVMTTATGAIGLILTKSFGFASELEWIPSLDLSGSGSSAARPSAPPKKRRRKNKAGLRSVPSASASEAEIDALLEQVNEQGFESLTKKQKQTLEQHAKEMRRRRDFDD